MNINMNKKILTALVSSTMLFSGAFVLSLTNKKVEQRVEAIEKPSTIDLNDTEEEEIRNYYSYLEDLDDSERRGMNLLKNLKYILVNNPSNPSKPAQYFTYGQVREIYQITDRNWVASPAEDIDGYDSEHNIIEGFKYNEDPYGYFYYRDDNFSNPHHLNDKITSKKGAQQTLLNQEHIWSKSHGFSEAGGVVNAGTDLHHLVAADVAGNKWGHSNFAYGYVDKESDDWIETKDNWDNGANAILGNKKGTPLNPDPRDTSSIIFEPRDEDKGDFARALLFMMARYNYIGHESETPSVKEPNLELVDYIYDDEFNTTKVGDVAYYGKLSDLLEFHRNDPVKVNDEYDFEVHRNNLIYENYQYTRNPFIDFPSWVELIWGDQSKTGVADPSRDPVYCYGEPTDPISANGVSLDESSITITARSSEKVTATVSPSNASNKRVTWNSSDESVATVNTKGVIYGISEGDAVITATTVDGGFTASVSVHVEPYYKGELVEDEITLITAKITSSSYSNIEFVGASETNYLLSVANENNAIKMNGSSTPRHYIYSTSTKGKVRQVDIDVNKGTSDGRKFYVFGSHAPITDKTDGVQLSFITYSSEELDEEGQIVTHFTFDIMEDYEYVLFSSNSTIYLDTIKITWEKPIEPSEVSLDKSSLNLDVGDTYQLVATVSPYAAENKNVTWTSSNVAVATVSDGLVTAKCVGTATVTVTTVVGNHEASCVVNVSKSESGSGKAEIVFSEVGYARGDEVAGVDIYTDSQTESQQIFCEFTKGGKSYYPRYYTGESALRVYSKQKIIITSPFANIISIDFVFVTDGGSSVKDDNAITANKGIYTELAASVATSSSWTSGSNMTNSVEFTVGGSSGQRRVVSITVTYYDSFAFAKDFLNETVCDDSGINPPSVNWTNLSNKAAVLFDSDKTYLKEAEASKTGNKVEQAVARYDYVVGKYGTSSYSDFLLRDPAPISHSGVSFVEESDNSIFVILLIAVSSLSTMVLLIIKKKKRYNK